ncbi:MAG: hypothetical protein KA247_01365 [Bacteroidetes bacterium]|nr:hypothetical protein [Bacteroidota bacterium]
MISTFAFIAMSKLLFLILIVTPVIFSQGNRSFSLYGEFGYGFSRTEYSSTRVGTGVNLALTGGVDQWLIKYSRRVNNESSLISPQEKINVNSILIGHSFILYRSFDELRHVTSELNITGYVGYGSIENQRRGRLLNSQWLNNSYEHVVEHGYGIPIELEIQYIIPHYQAGALSLFYNANDFRDYYGINLMIFAGYF